MKKNTGAKIGTMVASIAALGAIFGFVHRSVPASTANTVPLAVAPSQSQQVSSASTVSTQSSRPISQAVVHTTTRAS